MQIFILRTFSSSDWQYDVSPSCDQHRSVVQPSVVRQSVKPNVVDRTVRSEKNGDCLNFLKKIKFVYFFGDGGTLKVIKIAV